MKIGINLAFTHSRVWDDVIRTADELGIESAWFPDHLVLPVDTRGGPESDHKDEIPADTPLYDNFALLGHAAGRTEHIRLGTNVFLAGLRHPMVTARGFATADFLSGGRIEMGVGAGWLRGEFAAAGVDFDRRGGVLDEALHSIRALWTEEVIEHQGNSWQWGPVRFEPKPAPGSIPISIGGMSRAALRRVARHGDGWITLPQDSPADLAPHLATLHQFCDDLGRTTRPAITVMKMDVPPPHELPDWEAGGVSRIICRPWRRTSTAVEDLRAFAATYREHLATH